MFGGTGNDKYVGGAGNDHFVFISGEGVDTISDIYGADPGIDTLHVNFSSAEALLMLSADGNSLVIASQEEFADGSLDSYVVIENYFLNPDHGLVDKIQFTDVLIDI